jgi:pimeloyl-ACP methyl ester carboxylesterase
MSTCRVPFGASLLLGVTLTALAQSPAPSPPGKLIDIGGRHLHLNCVGTGAPTVMVENGGGSFSIEWTSVQQLVAKENRICTYDRAGYAWSDHGPLDESIEQVMDDLHLLIRKASIQTPVVMVCQSLGCIFTRAYQRRYPDQIVGLIFLDGSHDESITLVLDGKRVPIGLISREQLPKAYEEYRHSLPALKPGAASDPPFNRLSPDLQNARHWAFEKMVQEIGWLPNSIATAESWRDEFSALRQQRVSQPHPLGNLPLIVLERTKDTNPTWHAQQQQLAALSTKGKLIEAEESGHMIHLERPDLVAKAIQNVSAQSRNEH